MNEKELSKLNRKELLTLLLKAKEENDELLAQVAKLQGVVDKKELEMNECDSIAEAALSMNDVIKQAELACKQYLDNVKSQETIQIGLKQETEEYLAQMKQKCIDLETTTQANCDALEAATASKVSSMLDAAIKEADGYKNSVDSRLNAMKEQYENIFAMFKNVSSSIDQE